ncbi:MAG: hypothetical protein JOY55_09880 [Mycobacterium sp.]|nr:hypothetical protein [Mycobacterium sp.]
MRSLSAPRTTDTTFVPVKASDKDRNPAGRAARHGDQGPRHRRAGVRRRDTVKGGFYGEEPSLTDLDNGDLKPTMDFRDVYYDLLAHTIGIDPTPSVGAGRTSVGILG